MNHCPSDGDLLKFTIAGDPVLDGRYQLECRLGQGGMGLVYKARHIFLKTPHAIKIILPDLVGNDPSLVTRFRQEAMAAAAIRHPNIVAVTDFGVVNGTTPFLVMEFIQGKSLHDILNEEGRLAPGFAAEIMSGVCAGLSAAHRQGIIHRDLKPLNVMLRDEAPSVHEGVKLLDFGLAKIKSGELLGSFVAAQTTGLMGSPFYMAPEQWGEEEPDRRADIYSLGVIAYQMLAGEVPFKGPSIPAIMKKHLTGDVPGLVERNASVPPEMERAVMRALSKEPDARPQTVEEFVTELREAAGLSAATTTGSFARPLGVDTVAIKPSGDTLHAPQATGENLGGTIAPAEGGVSPHTVHAGPRTEAHIPPPKPRADARATVPLDAASALEVERARGGETARQHAGNETAFMPSETAYAPGGGSASTPDAPPVGHTSWTAPTEVLPPVEQVWGAGGETQAGVPETQLMESALIERKRNELLAEQERRAEAERNAGGAASAPPLNTTPLGATNLGQ
ncbi:MAG TPA: protein kinase, partial [Pyrinomonadaceae bacterium]|nr:protein kinase [Pyrinomonadaceae bacterium]